MIIFVLKEYDIKNNNFLFWIINVFEDRFCLGKITFLISFPKTIFSIMFLNLHTYIWNLYTLIYIYKL